MAHKNVNSVMAGRSFILLTLFALFAFLLLGTIFEMQVIDYETYQKEVIDQITVENTVGAERGTIYDSNMNVIAANQTTWRVFISPADIQDAEYSSAVERAVSALRYSDGVDAYVNSGSQAELIADGLSEILGVDREMILEKAAKKGRRDETIKKNVDKDAADQVLAFISENKLINQIHLEATNKRYYTYGTMAAQTIGFTGADGQGLYGLEYMYDEELTGVDGKYIIAQDARGNEMAYDYESYVEPIDGYDMITTIDERIQHELDIQVKSAVEDHAPNNRAVGIAMNPKTGAIYAISVQPDFDLNDPYTLDSISQTALEASGFEEGSEEYVNMRAELRQVMWSNKATTELYEPGSTFKPITTAMALEEGVVTPTETFTCTGVHRVGGWSIHCHKTSGHGTVTFARGLQQSCNPVLMTIAERVGTEKFCNYFEAFGYLEKSGIDLPGEATTIFFSRETMGASDLAVASFGQRFKVNPVSQLTAICTIANGGYLVTPHLLDKFVDDDGTVVYEYDTTPKRQVISTSTATTITEILEAGVSGDGGAKNAYVAGYKVAAKTGTSEKFDGTTSDDETFKARISSTIAYAPADDPQIAVIIMVDEPTGDSVYGSIVAAPYVSKFLENVLPYLGVEPEYTVEELENAQFTVSRYIGQDSETAKAEIAKLGISVEVVGGSGTVTSQVPVRGSVISKENGKIILYTNNADSAAKTVTVPSVLGLTAAEANTKIINAGLNIEIEGAQNYNKGSGAIVTSQSYSAGETVPYGTVVTVEVIHLDGSD
ncbi:MAG: PASTA domain-containing protein [Clostridia bacterium]|nr:PASTA domain-containing protein [Clostridia bacterium]